MLEFVGGSGLLMGDWPIAWWHEVERERFHDGSPHLHSGVWGCWGCLRCGWVGQSCAAVFLGHGFSRFLTAKDDLQPEAFVTHQAVIHLSAETMIGGHSAVLLQYFFIREDFPGWFLSGLGGFRVELAEYDDEIFRVVAQESSAADDCGVGHPGLGVALFFASAQDSLCDGSFSVAVVADEDWVRHEPPRSLSHGEWVGGPIGPPSVRGCPSCCCSRWPG